MAEAVMTKPVPAGTGANAAPLLTVQGLEGWYGESHVCTASPST